MQAKTFFTEQEQKQISEAIGEVEKTTAGEVAVMIVDRSDTYPESALLAGLLIGGAVSLAITDQFFHDSLWLFVPLLVVSGSLIAWLTNFMPDVKRFFTPQKRLEERVKDRALLSFYEKELYRTRDDTGVLFFISLFEHTVWVLADKGIYEKISSDELQKFALDVARGVKTGSAAEALCREIKRVGEILTEHFPIKDDDTNELPNKVIIG